VAGGGARVATIVVFNVALSALSCTGLSVVGWTAVALGLASLSPFLLMTAVALPKIRPHRWGGVPADKDWKLFFNTLFWNLNYWDSVSTMAGEVDRQGKTLPKALLSAVSMTSLGYLLPLMAATGATDAPPEEWGNGFFADAAGQSDQMKSPRNYCYLCLSSYTYVQRNQIKVAFLVVGRYVTLSSVFLVALDKAINYEFSNFMCFSSCHDILGWKSQYELPFLHLLIVE
jgi:amino acid transporter